MVDPERWDKWIALLTFVNIYGRPMTLGEYSLAMSYDNAPTVFNPEQEDSDNDGIGDAVDGAVLTAFDAELVLMGSYSGGYLTALLTAEAGPIPGQEVVFEFDSDGDGVDEIYVDYTDADGMASAEVTSLLPLGTTATFSASWDGIIVQAADEGQVKIVEKNPPEITKLVVSPSTLWPPDHRLKLITVYIEVTDDTDPDPEVSLKSVTSNEPDNGMADGNTVGDIRIDPDGSIYLRAERSAVGTGRIYTITYQATDDYGNSAEKSADVTVPNYKGK
jgi:hypothetical protein